MAEMLHLNQLGIQKENRSSVTEDIPWLKLFSYEYKLDSRIT